MILRKIHSDRRLTFWNAHIFIISVYCLVVGIRQILEKICKVRNKGFPLKLTDAEVGLIKIGAVFGIDAFQRLPITVIVPPRKWIITVPDNGNKSFQLAIFS